MSMNGGDAAEQMVRILLDGTETVVKITGEGARQLAAFLYAWAQQERGKNPAQHGRTSMVRLLRSGQELQVVGCGLSPRCSLTLSGLSPRPVLCVQRALTALDGTVIEPQDIPLSLRWSRLPPETLLLAAGAWLLAKGQVPEIS